LDLPPYLELEDLIDDPEARIGIGEGAPISHGEAEDIVERGVSSHGEAKRASGEAAANMGDGEG
jgi:hypothetical protein